MTFTYIKINEMRRIFDFVAFTFICLPQIFVICTNLKSLFNFKKKTEQAHNFALYEISKSNFFRNYLKRKY